MLVTLRLAANFFALFWVVGIYIPFLPAWLGGRGFSGEQIALVLACALWAKIPANLIVGARVDATGKRKPLLIGIAAVVLVGFASFLVLDDLVVVAVVCSLVVTALTTGIPVSDNLTLLAVRSAGVDFGRVRVWASLAFIAASSGGGWYLAGRDTESILHLLVAGAVVFLLVTLFLPAMPTEPRVSRKPAVIDAMRLPGFAPFLLTAPLLFASHAALYAFATLRWLEAGIGGSTVGLLWAEGVIVEVLVFTFASRLVGRFRISTLLLLAAAGAVIRWTALGLTTELSFLVVVQALHAATFAVNHLAAQTFILRHVPEKLSASAQGIYDALAGGLFFGLATLVAGRLYGLDGGYPFLAMVPMALVAGGVAMRMRRVW